jgi:acetyl-CoA carboxylase biotin carboxyl carrier protein
MINLKFIEKLIRTLDESGLDHVKVEHGGTQVWISRSPPIGSSEDLSGFPTVEEDAVLADGSPPDLSDRAEESEREGRGETLLEITSPMVGTFYRAPSPDADPFAKVGMQIAPGDLLCIIEAMKLMNELEAEMDGVIREICIGDGEPVEYGQVLFRVQPS